MPAPLFHVGQLVTPVENCHWFPNDNCLGIPLVVPQQGKVYEVADLLAIGEYWYLQLVEIPGGWSYRDNCFAPIEAASSEAVAELCAEAFTPVLA